MKRNGQAVQEAPSWAGDVWGGVAAMLVALPSSIAFGVLVYTAMGPQRAAEGAMAGVLGAAALGLIAPLIGRTGGLISAPCAPMAAVSGGASASGAATSENQRPFSFGKWCVMPHSSW